MRAEWEREAAVVARRGRLARIALGVEAAAHLSNVGIAMWKPVLLQELVSYELILLAVTAVLFLRWLHRAVDVAGTMSPMRLRWTSARAVWSFFIPVVSLWRPYQVIRDLHDQLAPDGVPEPAPRPRLDGSGGYRNVAMEAAPPPKKLARASIGLWWALFLIGGVYVDYSTPDASIFAVRDLLAFAGAMVAVAVVRAVDSRLAERFRRVRNASDAELQTWEVRA